MKKVGMHFKTGLAIRVNIEPYLQQFCGQIEQLSCGGESGPDARLCDYEWILNTRKQCLRHGVSFAFHQTGALFRRDGRIYHIDRRYQQSQAKKAGIDFSLHSPRMESSNFVSTSSLQ